MPPKAADDRYRQQVRLAELASVQAVQAWETGNVIQLGRQVTVMQYTAARDAEPYLNTFDTGTAGRVVPAAFAGVAGDGRSLLTLFEQAKTQALLQVMAATAVQDAGRSAVSAGITARPRLTGYVRMLSGSSCPRCAVLAGKWFRWNAGFQRHPRCFPAGVVVSGPAADAATRRWYEGELVTIRTASGQELPVTGNHPVLTDSGWVPAHLIQEGDYVVRSTRGQGAVPLVVPDEYQMPASIEDLWRPDRMVSLVGVPTTAEDFHGDGLNGEVDVVLANRFLRHRDVAVAASGQDREPISEELLAERVMTALGLAECGSFDQELVGLVGAAHSGMSSSGLGSALIEGHSPRTNLSSLGHAPYLDAVAQQSFSDGSATDAVADAERVLALAGRVRRRDFFGRQDQSASRWDAPAGSFTMESRVAYASRGQDLYGRLTGQVAVDRVVQVDRVQWSGHVFNLTSSEGWFSANGLIVSNCDCQHIPAAEDTADDLTTDPVAALRAGNVHGLSAADRQAILEDGADMGRIVNASRTTERAQAGRPPGARLMPDGIYDMAGDDRAEAQRLLRQYGFITT